MRDGLRFLLSGSKSAKKLTWVKRVASSTSSVPASSLNIELGHWRLYKSTSDAARKSICETAAAMSALADGTKVVCVDKFGDKRWAVAPDEVSLASHKRIVAWLAEVMPTLPKNNRPIIMKIESNYRQADLDVQKQIIASMLINIDEFIRIKNRQTGCHKIGIRIRFGFA